MLPKPVFQALLSQRATFTEVRNWFLFSIIILYSMAIENDVASSSRPTTVKLTRF